MQFHPIADIFPLIEGQEFADLVADIKQNGLLEPITVYDNQIVDGRNRFLACNEAGVDPRFEQWHKNGVSLVDWIVAKNLHRRHLTASQRAICSLDVLPFLEVEAKERQAVGHLNAPQYQGEKPVVQRIAQLEEGRSRDKAASLFNTNRQYVQDAKAIKERRPDLAEKVKGGALTIPQAKREIAKEDHAEKIIQFSKIDKQKPSVEIHDIVLADPPWRYDHQKASNRDVENHYPTADLQEICNHAPKTSDNAILFLWATAPKLKEAMQVIEAWGFEYKTNAIWDKEKIGMGYWFRGQHELLLVATKGSPGTPPECERRGSIFREARGVHSEKPQIVYEWIERAFPDRSKLEMYSRLRRPGWDVWGNEV